MRFIALLHAVACPPDAPTGAVETSWTKTGLTPLPREAVSSTTATCRRDKRESQI